MLGTVNGSRRAALDGTANVEFVDAYLAQAALAQGQAVCSFDEDFRRLDVTSSSPADGRPHRGEPRVWQTATKPPTLVEALAQQQCGG